MHFKDATIKSILNGSPLERWAENIKELSEIARQTNPPSSSSSSLDSYEQTSLTSIRPKSHNSWDKKQKRAFHCGLSGLKRCQYKNKVAFFLTLTSSPKTNHIDLRRDWDILVKRIRQQLKFKFEYIKVETFEGYGVIHALYHSAFEGWKYADIHAWFSKNWTEIHQANIVWNTVVDNKSKFSMKKCASYLCQYMSNQKGFYRRSTSQHWLFPAYRKQFLGLIQKHGFRVALLAWENLLMSEITQKRDNFDLIVAPI